MRRTGPHKVSIGYGVHRGVRVYPSAYARRVCKRRAGKVARAEGREACR